MISKRGAVRGRVVVAGVSVFSVFMLSACGEDGSGGGGSGAAVRSENELCKRALNLVRGVWGEQSEITIKPHMSAVDDQFDDSVSCWFENGNNRYGELKLSKIDPSEKVLDKFDRVVSVDKDRVQVKYTGNINPHFGLEFGGWGGELELRRPNKDESFSTPTDHEIDAGARVLAETLHLVVG
ncbi:hypothetical protein [Nocardia australiensis]|uniref:hypothetical protein n=1 Tax=Nocardia australiensis TaxID=2887191 RepID=UPI001D157DCC|nr:hypothetical protein [Nocardia australiensis]